MTRIWAKSKDRAPAVRPTRPVGGDQNRTGLGCPRASLRLPFAVIALCLTLLFPQITHAACTSPAGAAGMVYYNSAHAAIYYCNDTNWVHAGVGSYNPNAVDFDGTNDYLQTATMTGMDDGERFSASLWIRPHLQGTDTDQVVFENTAGTFKISLDREGTNNDKYSIYFVALDSGYGNQALVGTAENLDAGQWYHVMFSTDTGAGVSHLYLNGVSDKGFEDVQAGNIAIAGGPFAVGAATGGGSKLAADIADLWIDVGTYIDLSNASMRAKFLGPNNMPMYLGADGSLPTGSAPEIFLAGDTSSWHTNKGTGGGFTENGALATAASLPADTIIPPGDISTGLIARWALDETSGTTTVDSTGANDGTFSGNANVVSASGQIGTALVFDGSDDVVTVTAPAELADLGPASWAFWVYRNSTADGTLLYKSDDNTDEGWWIDFESGYGGVGFTAVHSSLNLRRYNSVPGAGEWFHVVITWTGATASTSVNIYINGEITPIDGTDDSGSGTHASDATRDLFIGDGGAGASGNFDGRLDDVRIYDRVLGADDVKLLYNCSAPPGTIRYDSGYNVMAYCNGAEWVAMGPIGGEPPTDGLVGYWKMDETSGTTAADSSGNGHNGSMLNGLSGGTNSVDGKIDTALDYYGSNEYVSIPHHADFDNLNDITIASWVRRDNINDKYDPILAKTNSSGNYPLTFEICHSSGGACGASDNNKLSLYSGKTAPGQVTSSATITDTDWHFVAVTRSGTAVTFYIDGVEAGTATMSNSFGADALNLRIGRESSGAPSFDGKLDDVRLYNRALSADEIQLLYQYGVLDGNIIGGSGNCSNPVRPAGNMIYNVDHNVLQYCNGDEWIGIGQ